MSNLIIFIHGIGSNNSTWEKFIETLKADNSTKQCEQYVLNTTEIKPNKTYYHLYEYESKVTNQPKVIKFFTEKIAGNKKGTTSSTF